MSSKLNRALASPDPKILKASQIHHCYTDFMLSREAMMVSPGTIRFYEYTAGQFVRWLVFKGIINPEQIQVRDVREYLSEYIQAGAKASYVNGHARAIRTFIKFLHEEKHIEETVNFKMPPSGINERLPFLSEEEVNKVLKACSTPRDKALIMLMVDSGLRRAELLALNWEDVDIKTGVVKVGNHVR